MAVGLIVGSAPLTTATARHDSMMLLWAPDGDDCRETPMDPVTPSSWRCWIALPESTATCCNSVVYSKFLIDGQLTPAHYGQDLLRSDGLQLAPNPPAVVAELEACGYYGLRIDESALTYGIRAAPGGIRATVTFADTEPPVPETVLAATCVSVQDLDRKVFLGRYYCEPSVPAIFISRLLAGRCYRLIFTAPGYQDLEIVQYLDGPQPQHISVILLKTVNLETTSWGACKESYR